eukprot:TRINITY_DN15196_c0_g1_i1.p1 TRINITY_DN15196_c0_g1~~TRINITY_DN15196_c0_g1_i1.p1  ORF type:complete len:1314 (+),score=192.09 TRINITY_DN15196_c0_g1_i1:30-3944(+)
MEAENCGGGRHHTSAREEYRRALLELRQEEMEEEKVARKGTGMAVSPAKPLAIPRPPASPPLLPSLADRWNVAASPAEQVLWANEGLKYYQYVVRMQHDQIATVPTRDAAVEAKPAEPPKELSRDLTLVPRETRPTTDRPIETQQEEWEACREKYEHDRSEWMTSQERLASEYRARIKQLELALLRPRSAKSAKRDAATVTIPQPPPSGPVSRPPSRVGSARETSVSRAQSPRQPLASPKIPVDSNHDDIFWCPRAETRGPVRPRSGGPKRQSSLLKSVPPQSPSPSVSSPHPLFSSPTPDLSLRTVRKAEKNSDQGHLFELDKRFKDLETRGALLAEKESFFQAEEDKRRAELFAAESALLDRELAIKRRESELLQKGNALQLHSIELEELYSRNAVTTEALQEREGYVLEMLLGFATIHNRTDVVSRERRKQAERNFEATTRALLRPVMARIQEDEAFSRQGILNDATLSFELLKLRCAEERVHRKEMYMRVAFSSTQKEQDMLSQEWEGLRRAEAAARENAAAVEAAISRTQRALQTAVHILCAPEKTRAQHRKEMDGVLNRLCVTGSTSGQEWDFFVYADVPAAIYLWKVDPKAAAIALQRYSQICIDNLDRLGGAVQEQSGDALVLAFPNADAAVNWCLSVQVALLGLKWHHPGPGSVGRGNIRFAVDSRPRKSTDGSPLSKIRAGEILVSHQIYEAAALMEDTKWATLCSVSPSEFAANYYLVEPLALRGVPVWGSAAVYGEEREELPTAISGSLETLLSALESEASKLLNGEGIVEYALECGVAERHRAEIAGLEAARLRAQKEAEAVTAQRKEFEAWRSSLEGRIRRFLQFANEHAESGLPVRQTPKHVLHFNRLICPAGKQLVSVSEADVAELQRHSISAFAHVTTFGGLGMLPVAFQVLSGRISSQLCYVSRLWTTSAAILWVAQEFDIPFRDVALKVNTSIILPSDDSFLAALFAALASRSQQSLPVLVEITTRGGFWLCRYQARVPSANAFFDEPTAAELELLPQPILHSDCGEVTVYAAVPLTPELGVTQFLSLQHNTEQSFCLPFGSADEGAKLTILVPPAAILHDCRLAVALPQGLGAWQGTSAAPEQKSYHPAFAPFSIGLDAETVSRLPLEFSVGPIPADAILEPLHVCVFDRQRGLWLREPDIRVTRNVTARTAHFHLPPTVGLFALRSGLEDIPLNLDALPPPMTGDSPHELRVNRDQAGGAVVYHAPIALCGPESRKLVRVAASPAIAAQALIETPGAAAEEPLLLAESRVARRSQGGPEVWCVPAGDALVTRLLVRTNEALWC